MCHLILPRIDKPHLDHTRVQDITSEVRRADGVRRASGVVDVPPQRISASDVASSAQRASSSA
jgi:hypothetical protein